MNNLKKDVVIVENNPLTLMLLESYLKSNFEDLSFVNFETPFEASGFITQVGCKICVFDTDNKTDEFFPFVEYIKKLIPDSKILSLTSNHNSGFLFKLMRNGFDSFIFKPVLEKEFKYTINKFLAIQENNLCNVQNGKLISFFANKGGIGKTSIATNFALELSKISHKNTLVLDLNFQQNDVNNFLHLTSKLDFENVLKDKNIINTDYIKNLFTKYKNTNLYTLSANTKTLKELSVNATEFVQLCECLKQHFAYIIVDTNSLFDTFSELTLKASDLVFLVSNVNIPTLNNTKKILNLLNKYNISDTKIKLILNRYIESGQILVSDMEKFLGKKIFWKIPNDYLTQIHALDRGVVVSELSENSEISKSYRGLAVEIAEISVGG